MKEYRRAMPNIYRRPFYSKVVRAHTHTHTRTQPTDCSTRSLKWSANMMNNLLKLKFILYINTKMPLSRKYTNSRNVQSYRRAIPRRRQQHTSLATCDRDLFNNRLTLTFDLMISESVHAECLRWSIHVCPPTSVLIAQGVFL